LGGRRDKMQEWREIWWDDGEMPGLAFRHNFQMIRTVVDVVAESSDAHFFPECIVV